MSIIAGLEQFPDELRSARLLYHKQRDGGCRDDARTRLERRLLDGEGEGHATEPDQLYAERHLSKRVRSKVCCVSRVCVLVHTDPQLLLNIVLEFKYFINVLELMAAVFLNVF